MTNSPQADDLTHLTKEYLLWLEEVKKLTDIWADTQDAWQCHIEGDTPQTYARFLDAESASLSDWEVFYG